MKTIKIHLRVVAFFFSALILFQGCTVYKSANVTLDEAVKADTKVRIEKKNGERLKYFKVVVLDDGNYYGKKKEKWIFNNIIIEENSIEKIQIKDKQASTIWTIAIPVVIIGVLIGAVAIGLERANFGPAGLSHNSL